MTGELIQNGGASYTNGSGTTTSTRYQAASGALVFSSGTNNWSRGLGVNMAGSGEPNTDIEQATANLLVDMGVAPTTPMTGHHHRGSDGPARDGPLPVRRPMDVASTSPISIGLDLTLAPSTVTQSTVSLTGPSGPVAAGVSYDVGTKHITLTPTASLKASTTYTVSVDGSIGTPWGTTLGVAPDLELHDARGSRARRHVPHPDRGRERARPDAVDHGDVQPDARSVDHHHERRHPDRSERPRRGDRHL